MIELEVIAVLPHIWIVPLVAVLPYAVSIWLRRKATRAAVAATKRNEERYKYTSVDPEKWWDTGWGMLTIILRSLAVVVAIIAVLTASIPFGPKYWSIYTVTGTVEDV